MTGKVEITRFELGPLASNCYLAHNRNEGILIDPGWPYGIERITEYAENYGVKVKAIVATHGHFDHVLGVSRAKDLFEAPFLMHRADEQLALNAREAAMLMLGIPLGEQVPPPDDYLEEGSTITFGGIDLVVLWTPGHSPGSITLYTRGYAFVGDLLFKGSIGRVDLPGASPEIMRRSLRRLIELPADTILYPGHGPSTTLREELDENIVLKLFLEGNL
ncbi:MAG: MBL fold metallo-hydrolase [Desulfurococcales archaeon]|nr:MBL fold metallo-hydrolase [Desulfurococcales archaeon]